MSALTLRLLTLLFGICFCSAIRDRQLFSGGTGTPATYTTSDVTIVDRDNNGVKPSAELLSSSILLRMETMPADNDINAPNIHENNLVFFPFIANPTGNEMVELRLTYNHNRECPGYVGVQPAAVQCKDYFKIMLVPMSANTDVNILTVADLNSVRVVTLTPGAGNTAKDISVDEIFNFPASTEGYRVVVHDEGSSFTLKHTTVNRFYCRHNVESNQLRLTCPDNPATDAKNTTVTCTCAAANSIHPPGQPITKLCVFDNAAQNAYYQDFAVNQRCKCEAGYTYTDVGGGVRECLASQTTQSQTQTVPSSTTIGQSSPTVKSSSATTTISAPKTSSGSTPTPAPTPTPTPGSASSTQKPNSILPTVTKIVGIATTSGAPVAAVTGLTPIIAAIATIVIAANF